jgi:hypothetical protein
MLPPAAIESPVDSSAGAMKTEHWKAIVFGLAGLLLWLVYSDRRTVVAEADIDVYHVSRIDAMQVAKIHFPGKEVKGFSCVQKSDNNFVGTDTTVKCFVLSK